MKFQKYLLNIFIFPVLFSCSSTPLPNTEFLDIPEDLIGIVHAGRTNTREEYIFLDTLGAKWILRTFYWRAIEKEKGNFDFSVYDEYVDAAKREGKKIIAVLGYETPWLFPKEKQRRYISPENMPLFLRYIEETVRHFKGRIDVWQIWNEPNLFFWKGPDKDFFELTIQAAQIIRKTDPDAYILGGVFWRTPEQFIKKMYESGAMKDLDALSFHPYAANPSGTMKLYDNLLKIFAEIGYSGPLWITETGYPTGGWYLSRVSLEKYPSYIVKTLAGTAARGARTVFWYQLFDYRNNGELSRFFNSSEDFFGLAYPDYQRKDGAFAFGLCASYLPGSRFISDYAVRENIPKEIVSLCFLEGISGTNTLILWNDRSCCQKITLQLSDPAFIHDISTNNKSPLQKETVLKIGQNPVFITWQGKAIPRLTKEKR